MKKLLAVLLLILFLFNSMGYYFIFELNKHFVKREMQRLTLSGHGNYRLSVLKIDHPEKNRDFKRLDKREFRYNGCLFDILREVKKGDSVTYFCIHDEKEEKILAGMRQTRQLKFFNILLRHIVHHAIPGYLSAPPEEIAKNFNFIPPSFLTENIFLPILSPPPEVS